MTGKLASPAAQPSSHARRCNLRVPLRAGTGVSPVELQRLPRRRAVEVLAVFASLTALQCDDGDAPNAVSLTDEGGTSIDAGAGTAGTAGRGAAGVGGRPAAEPQMHRDAANEAAGSSGETDLPGDAAADGTDDPQDVADVVVPDGPPGPTRCGDGWRDSATEECDDGPGSSADFCDDTCRVRDVLIAPNVAPDGALRPPGRVLGQGRHPVAAGSSGFAVAFVSREPEPAVKLRAFEPHSAPLGDAITVSSGTAVIDASAPVVGALPSGAYAVAWTDLNGDGDLRGIAFTIVNPAQPTNVPPASFVNVQRRFSQDAPDLVVTDSEIVVTWRDDADIATAPDLRYRRLSHSGTPLSAADETLVQTKAGEGNAVLARFGSSWAAAWRSGDPAGEIIQVRAGNSAWSVGPFLQGGAAEDKPALVEIDSTRLFLVFVERAWGDSGAQPTSRLRCAVLDTAAPGRVDALPLAPRVEPWSLDPALAQEQPSAARAGDTLYVAWHSGRVIGDARAQESWLKRIDVRHAAGGVTLDFSTPEVELPREAAHSPNDQRYPALAAGAVPGSAAIVAAWDDYGRSFGTDQGAPDVAVELIPTPILRLSARRLER
jgi:hypothetical protein